MAPAPGTTASLRGMYFLSNATELSRAPAARVANLGHHVPVVSWTPSNANSGAPLPLRSGSMVSWRMCTGAGKPIWPIVAPLAALRTVTVTLGTVVSCTSVEGPVTRR